MRRGASVLQNAADVSCNVCGSDSTFAHAEVPEAQQDNSSLLGFAVIFWMIRPARHRGGIPRVKLKTSGL
jgi:hypothetical protein